MIHISSWWPKGVLGSHTHTFVIMQSLFWNTHRNASLFSAGFQRLILNQPIKLHPLKSERMLSSMRQDESPHANIPSLYTFVNIKCMLVRALLINTSLINSVALSNGFQCFIIVYLFYITEWIWNCRPVQSAFQNKGHLSKLNIAEKFMQPNYSICMHLKNLQICCRGKRTYIYWISGW